MTMDINHSLSLNVTNAPVPALFPDHSSIFLKNSGFFKVTVKDSQADSGRRE